MIIENFMNNNNQGWECPVCHIGVAPWMSHCPMCAKMESVIESETTNIPIVTPYPDTVSPSTTDTITSGKHEGTLWYKCEILPEIMFGIDWANDIDYTVMRFYNRDRDK